MRLYTLNREGNYYKGNLHTHTTVSDGRYSPLDTIERYKRNGYHFLAITDHMVYSYFSECENAEFLSIPAAEVHTSKGGAGLHHMIAFGDPKTTKFGNGERLDQAFFNQMSTQELIDYLLERDNLVIYNHPHWSRDCIRDIIDLKNLVGIEIYNHNCQIEWRCGNAEVFYDHLLWHENYVWCFATDDAHGGGGTNDYCGGYITVKTNDFSHKGILTAIRDGSFYASASREGETAPIIRDFIFEDGIAKLWCSESRDVNFFAGQKSYPTIFPGGYSFRSFQAGKSCPITYAEFKVPEDAKFVKVSAQDFAGNISWCQPIFL
ncbi:MAG: PHP domain-containing protein [Bacillota bacterium]|nr:PHP domain-containing protein [Bacillota bacterium]